MPKGLCCFPNGASIDDGKVSVGGSTSFWLEKFSGTDGNGELALIIFKAAQSTVPSYSGQPVSEFRYCFKK